MAKFIKIQQYCHISRTYKKECEPNKLCEPEYHFDQLEKCSICKKII